MTTLKLNGSWDLELDATGDMIATDQYLAQDVASACRTFKGEYIFDTDYGIPYFQDVLGKGDIPMLQHYLDVQGKEVEGVEQLQFRNLSLTKRGVTGTILINNDTEVVI